MIEIKFAIGILIGLFSITFLAYYNIILFEKTKYIALTTQEQQLSIISNIIILVIIMILVLWDLYLFIVTNE